MLNIPLSGIKKIEAIAQSSDEYISLSQGALKIGGIPKQIKKHLQEILITDKTDYYQSAWGIIELRKKLSQILSKQHSTKISANQIIITHGCIGGLSTLLFTILDKGDQIILPEPTYPAYEKLALLVRAEPVFISCINKNSKNKNLFQFNIEKIKKATTSKTKVIIFSNPWNPLGIIISKKEILELLDWCEKNKIYLIIDEAYKDYCFDNTFESVIPLINQSEFIIEVSSFSKSMGMSGWRIGYIVTHPNLCEQMGKTQDAILNCPNVPSQYAVFYALNYPQFTDQFYKIIKSNFDLSIQTLAPLVKEKIFNIQKPSGGFFLFLKTEIKDATDLCMNILSKAKVSLVPGKFFGPSGSPFLRLCYAREQKVLMQGLDRLIKFFL
ncbi:pyridoxal phosphate-dependent aminotransferase [Candidatus Babeliales bacterium]|nr:pyridoxal phosphate-dependent aminotransferase [Candidatus Babeliales bacterium]